MGEGEQVEGERRAAEGLELGRAGACGGGDHRDLGMTVLLVEQKLPLARRVADRFHILDKGRSVADGPIEALDDEVVRRFLTV